VLQLLKYGSNLSLGHIAKVAPSKQPAALLIDFEPKNTQEIKWTSVFSEEMFVTNLPKGHREHRSLLHCSLLQSIVVRFSQLLHPKPLYCDGFLLKARGNGASYHKLSLLHALMQLGRIPMILYRQHTNRVVHYENEYLEVPPPPSFPQSLLL
jgi:hypothetical protein